MSPNNPHFLGHRPHQEIQNHMRNQQPAASQTSTPRIHVPEHEAKGLNVTPYMESDGRICHRKFREEGVHLLPLANFTAHIVGEVVRDDGAERQTFLALEGRLDSGQSLERIEVPSAQFAGLAWIIKDWGARAVVYAGNGIKDHLRAALQCLSPSPERRLIYAHTGWREIEGEWCYLHTGGAIGASGPVKGIEVDPGGKLHSFTLPDPPSGEALRMAVRASLGFLDVAPDSVTVPLFLACYRAPLGPSPFALHLVGRTGNGKSVLQGIAQSHWGCTFDHMSIPGNWQSTRTALEVLTFAAKDAVLCVDDFAPDGSKQEQARLQGTMAHLFRTVGNGSSRDRCTDAATLKASRVPRCLVISSGEDLPAGHSIRARVLCLETEPNTTRWDRVTLMQAHAKEGRLAAAMSAYVHWLAPQVPTMAGMIAERLGALREHFKATHKRTTDQVAQLLIGGEMFLRFAQETGVIDAPEAQALEARFKHALQMLTEAQAETQAASDPTRRFLEILNGLFVSGRAHLEGIDTFKPEHAERLGWVQRTDAAPGELEPKGPRIGWEDSRILYLEPEATYSAIQSACGSEPFPVTKNTLWKRLHEKKILLIGETDRNTRKIPGRGKGIRGIAIKSSVLELDDAANCPYGVFGEVA